jgi:hypothetical protein
VTEWDLTGDYDPPPETEWPPPADDPDVEPEEDWAVDSEGGEAS